VTVVRRGFLVALVYCSLSISIISSLGALLIPTIAQQQHVSQAAAQWILTVALVVGVVATPVLGALSDGRWRRRVLLVTMAGILFGTVLAATAQSFGQLLAGRAFQGLGYGVIPMAMSMANRYLPPERRMRAIAILSVTAVTGSGLAFPVTGLIVRLWGLHAAFWFGAVFASVGLIAMALTAPEDAAAPALPGRLDILGGLLLAVALAGLVLIVSEGAGWGWGSRPVLALGAMTAVTLPLWAWQELRAERPLVDLRTLSNRTVLLANGAALGIGGVLFASFSVISQLAQIPTRAGYGLGLGTLAAGFVLLPNSVGGQISTRIVLRLSRRVSPVRLLAVSPALLGAVTALLARWHDELWQLLAATFVQGLAIGAGYVLMATLVADAVDRDRLGAAAGLNQVLRTLGGAIGSAAVGAVVAGATLPGQRIPTESAYTTSLTGTAVGCAVLALVLACAGWSSRAPRSGATPKSVTADRADGLVPPSAVDVPT
jgi:MFS family permease